MNEAAIYRKNKQEIKFKSATVEKIQKGFKQHEKIVTNSEKQNKAQKLWHKAFNAVRIRIMKEKFTLLTNKMVFIPNDVHTVCISACVVDFLISCTGVVIGIVVTNVFHGIVV